MNKHNIFKRRLLRLADELDKTKEEFNYAVYAEDCDKNGRLSCGSAACALGLGATINSFRKMGMRLIRCCNDKIGVVLRKNLPVGDKDAYQVSRETACEVFGLDNEQFDYLFIPDANVYEYGSSPACTATAHEVADHIRNFVKNHMGDNDGIA